MGIATARSRPVSPGLIAGIVALVFAVLAASAMLHTSATFDEIVFMAVGARGFHTGDFSLVTDHPRLPQYLYGLPLYLSGITYPSEALLTYDALPRYIYSRNLLWGVGNPAESLIMLSRLVAIVIGTATVAATYVFARRHMGAFAAIAAAALVAFLPDMLAHSGVAYNDIALAFGFLASLYAIDAAVRDPSPKRAAWAGVAIAFTLGVKYSGVILAPIAVTLIGLEAVSGRWQDRAWRGAIMKAALVCVAVVYVLLVVIYAGDWRLAQFAGGLRESLEGAAG
ncbi:MAG TPA: phospholipid carrier-dependent glycosyltransferase, partial [Usitatibacter sp.]